jgi:hypothetical protein
VEVVKKISGGNWVYVIDSPYGTALSFGVAPRVPPPTPRTGYALLMRSTTALHGRQAKHTTHDRDAPLHKHHSRQVAYAHAS